MHLRVSLQQLIELRFTVQPTTIDSTARRKSLSRANSLNDMPATSALVPVLRATRQAPMLRAVKAAMAISSCFEIISLPVFFRIQPSSWETSSTKKHRSGDDWLVRRDRVHGSIRREVLYEAARIYWYCGWCGGDVVKHGSGATNQ